MTVTVNVLSITDNSVMVECIDDKTSHRIMRTPIRFKQCTKSSIEKAINDTLKNFKSPVWGGFSIVYYVQV